MISLANIWNVARIEAKTLMRSWFFRIFAGICILTLILFDVTLFVFREASNRSWMFRALPSSLPYSNLLLLNVAQAVIAVFLASDFLKRDRRLDTSEVIYMRSMTNGDYVLGKTAGILLVFFVLNAAVLLISLIFNIFFSDIPVRWAAYFWYPLLIGLPTLLFILGLSFVAMSLIQNQPVTFAVLLGYIALTLFYLNKKLFGVFDYMAFFLPLTYSDFVGFGDLGPVLLQRGAYLLLGLSGILTTVALLRRLPQSRTMVWFSRGLAPVLAAAGMLLGSGFVLQHRTGERMREQIRQLNRTYQNHPIPLVTSCDLSVKHRGKFLEIVAAIHLRNPDTTSLRQYLFRLNPGFRVVSVRRGDTPLPFRQNLHLLEIEPPAPLQPGASDSFQVVYRGTVDERACYPDVPEEERQQRFRFFLYTVQKRHAFVEPHFVLLTPESGWYPQPGPGFYPDQPERYRSNFVRYRLTVQADSALQTISQGSVSRLASGTVRFVPETPLPGLTLIIGPYQFRALEVDSIEYRLAILPEHDYFSNMLGKLNDTLAAIIRDERDNFEADLGLFYPFRRLQLVEVPIQFATYRHIWTLARETVQPEMVLLPEKGLLIETADFEGYVRRSRRWRWFRNMQLSEKELLSRAFSSFIRSTFFRGRAFRFSGGALSGITADAYKILPNYLTYVYNLSPERWPVFQAALEAYFGSLTVPPEFGGFRFWEGITDEEKVHIALTEKSFLQLLRDPDFRQLVPQLVREQGEFLFYTLLSRIGPGDFEDFLYTWLDTHMFQNLRAEDFVEEVRRRFGFDLAAFLDRWYRSEKLPAFLFSPIERYAVLDEDFTRYQIRFRVTNTSDADGVLRITFRMAGRGMGFGFGEGGDTERIFYIRGGETKEIGIVLDAQPRAMTVETFISRNLPSTLTFPIREMELNERAQPFDGERTVDEPVNLQMPGEIIVDNEDPGFSVEETQTTSFLRRLLRREDDNTEKYVGLRFWNPPSSWKAAINANFFGRVVRSAHFIRSGSGDKKAVWTAQIPENGYYEVYAFVYRSRRFGRWRRGTRRMGVYHYLIHHEGGTDEILLDLDRAEDGWNLLGSFYFSRGPARVELTNESNARIVIADAIKWVQQ